MSMLPPDHRMQSISTAMNAHMAGVFFDEILPTSNMRKQQKAVIFTNRYGTFASINFPSLGFTIYGLDKLLAA